jgi:glycogen operon protein
MFRAGDEFLQTQLGDRNPYNIDDTRTWLDWGRLKAHGDVFRFVQRMVAFRKRNSWIVRSTFWRGDVHWYGVGSHPDLSYDSHSLAYCLCSGTEDHEAIYVMINAYWEPLEFTLQEGKPQEWRRIVDTHSESPCDFVDHPDAPVLTTATCMVQPRSIVVFQRSQGAAKPPRSTDDSPAARSRRPKERKR